MKYHILRDCAGLAGLVSSADELLIAAEGLFADAEEVAKQLGERPCILLRPIEGAVDAGFERIDLNFASAGIALVPGYLVEKLHDLPPDCDVVSTLTRIALQAGVRRQEVPSLLGNGVRWQIIRNESEARSGEDIWLQRSVACPGPTSPGLLLSRLVALGLGAPLLHLRYGVALTGWFALLLMVLAALMSWFDLAVFGIAACGIAWLLLRVVHLLRGIDIRLTSARWPAFPASGVVDWLFDFVLAGILAMETSATGDTARVESLFAPVMLMLVLRIAGATLSGWNAAILRDRAVLCAALLVVAVVMAESIMVCVELIAIAAAIATITRIGRTHQAHG